jgi:cytochrome c oxidase subunit II
MKLKTWIVPLVLAIIAAAAPVGHSQEPRHIEIGLSRFSFSPGEITLKRGDPVVLVLTSHDVTHGLAISELGLRKDVVGGQTAELAFTPMRAGTFVGRCSYFCGPGHVSMILTINVVE